MWCPGSEVAQVAGLLGADDLHEGQRVVTLGDVLQRDDPGVDVGGDLGHALGGGDGEDGRFDVLGLGPGPEQSTVSSRFMLGGRSSAVLLSRDSEWTVAWY